MARRRYKSDRPTKTQPIVFEQAEEPLTIERRSWRPQKMTPEQADEMQAIAERIAALWVPLAAALKESLASQNRCQGGWPNGIAGAARRARQEIQLHLYWLTVRAEPKLPEFVFPEI